MNVCELQYLKGGPDDGSREGGSSACALALLSDDVYTYIVSQGRNQIIVHDAGPKRPGNQAAFYLQGAYQAMVPYYGEDNCKWLLVGTTGGLYVYQFVAPAGPKVVDEKCAVPQVSVSDYFIIYTREIKLGERSAKPSFRACGAQNMDIARRLTEQHSRSGAPHRGDEGTVHGRSSTRDTSKYYEIIVGKWALRGGMHYLKVIDGCVVAGGKFSIVDNYECIKITVLLANTRSLAVYVYFKESNEVCSEPLSYYVQRQFASYFDGEMAPSNVLKARDMVYVTCNDFLYAYNMGTETIAKVQQVDICRLILTPAKNALIVKDRGLYLACYNREYNEIVVHTLCEFGANIRIGDAIIVGSSIVCCGGIEVTSEAFSNGKNVRTVKWKPIMMRLVGAEQ